MRSFLFPGTAFSSVAEVVVDLGVAGLTETHEVVPCVSAAFGNGQEKIVAIGLSTANGSMSYEELLQWGMEHRA